MQLRTAVRHFRMGYFATRQRSEKTKKAYGLDLEQFMEFAKPRTHLTSIDPDLIERWAQHLQAEGYAPASLRRKLASLRVFFLYWVRKRQLESSPMWQIRLCFSRSQDLPRCLSKAEVRSLLRVAQRRASHWDLDAIERPGTAYRDVRNLALVNLLFATGIRVGEAAAMNLADMRLDEKAVVVRGKGGRMRLGFLTTPQAFLIHKEYLSVRNRIAARSDALFVNARSDRLSPQGIAYGIRSLAVAAGLERHVTPHMLRHTVATLLLRAGADLRAVQVFLGHASISSTQRYTHVAQSHLLSTLRRFHPGKQLLSDRM